MNITVDTNFLISATQWHSSVAHKLLLKLVEANVQICASEEIISELIEVLQRDFGYNDIMLKDITRYVLSFVTIVEPAWKVDVIKDDPDDNKIIECALESESKYILTYDKHLLTLKEYRGIRIIKPEEARALI